ncbi:hypothetical protein DV736_g6497, partial [Chaetothyriales sp. CBS 134916]
MSSTEASNASQPAAPPKGGIYITQQQLEALITQALDNREGQQQASESRVTAQGGQKLQKWPEWNGESTSFPLYIARLEAKIKADRSKIGNGKTIYNGILGTLPEDKQQRVSHWFISGGLDSQYNIDDFLKHIKDKFEDKEAKQTAGDQLNRIHIGDAQKFDDFLQDFKFKLSQCRGLE